VSFFARMKELLIKLRTTIRISDVVSWSHSMRKSKIGTKTQFEIVVIVMISIHISTRGDCISAHL